MSKKIEYSFTKYKQRNITPLKVVTNNNWNIKVYGINLTSLPNTTILDYLFKQLPAPALTPVRYGVGFLIIHKGIAANWFLLNWWGLEDIVHQKLFHSPVDNLEDIQQVADETILACVHELDIYHFESAAWKKHVLSSGKPDFENYLTSLLRTGE